MKSSISSCKTARERHGKARMGHAVFLILLFTAMLGLAHKAQAQVVYGGDEGGMTLAAGATATGYTVQYGQQKLLGITGVVDLDTRRRFGFEGETQWMMFHETNQLHLNTYLAGARYHHSFGKFLVYGKGLVGVGQFHFPYNLAQGNYLVIAPGGGVDYRWTRRISFRLADAEYQFWPQFTFGHMSNIGLSAGVQYHILRSAR